jgi:hypothetical protein
VVKEPTTGNFGCYIITIIPDEANASTSYDAVTRMYNACDPNTKFSGTALYTIPGDNAYAVAAGRYKNGERYAAASFWFDNNGGTQQLEKDINVQLGIREIRYWARTIIKGIEINLSGIGGSDPSQGTEWNIPRPPPPPPPRPPTQPMTQAEQDSYDKWVSSLSPSSTSGNGASGTSSGSSGSGNSESPEAAAARAKAEAEAWANYQAWLAHEQSKVPAGNSYSNTTNTTNTPLPSSNGNRPANYVYHQSDIFLNNNNFLDRNKRPLDPPPTVIITPETGGLVCGPNVMAYVYRLFRNHSGKDPKIAPGFYTEELEDGRYKDRRGRILNVKDEGVQLVDLKHYIVDNDNSHFKVNKALSNSISNVVPPKTPAEALRDVLKDKNRVVITAIPLGGIGHVIVIVGYRENGDVIYMDPARGMQAVWANPNFIRLDQLAIVIEGIK